MGRGGVLRDGQGRWIAGFFVMELGGSPLRAEALVLRCGLALAWERGVRKMTCETDCADFIDALGMQDVEQSFQVLGEIRDFLAKDWEVVLRRIPRECNLTTDHLARIGAVATTPTLCILDVPSFQLEALMFRDSLGSL